MRRKRIILTTILAILSLVVCCLIGTQKFGVGPVQCAAVSNTANASESDTDFVVAELSNQLPQYKGDPYFEVNEDIPFFTEEELHTVKDITYSKLDDFGRCGTAMGLIGPDTMPTEDRESIGDIRPSGWHTVRYDDRIEDRYLYNRCHLIGYQLAGANAEPRNLITGTRYLNVEGMLPLENTIWRYVTVSGNHVLYRVTPIFEEDNLVASGLLVEAYSIEDGGEGICFCRYLFNVQPGVIIDYKTGDSKADSEYIVVDEGPDALVFLPLDQKTDQPIPSRTLPDDSSEEEIRYVLNTNTMRFHHPNCSSVQEIKSKNKAFSSEPRESLIGSGYKPCGRCKP